MIGLKASLEMFEKAGIEAIRKKVFDLPHFSNIYLQQLPQLSFEIITPATTQDRGAQLSFIF
jgi:kynureninase